MQHSRGMHKTPSNVYRQMSKYPKVQTTESIVGTIQQVSCIERIVWDLDVRSTSFVHGDTTRPRNEKMKCTHNPQNVRNFCVDEFLLNV